MYSNKNNIEQQKILINIHTSDTKIHKYYIDSFEELKNNYNIKTYIFTGIINKEDINRINELKEKGIFISEYYNENDIFEKISNLKKENKIIYLNTFTENLIILTNKIKKELGQKVTDNFELFRNKKLQRELLLNYDKNITVNYLEKKLKDLDFEKLKKEFGLPFILKPKDGVESSGVAKIEKINDFENYKKNNDLESEILVEEFIDGEFYNINYFVNEQGKIFFTSPVREIVAIEYNINDFFSPVRIMSEKSLKELLNYNIKEFIEKSVKACSIKNSFVHQEFKLTSKKQLKNIELNGRIGGYRLEMYKDGYGINLLEIPFNKKDYFNKKIKNNFAAFAIYPEKKCKLISYNYELLEKIKKLESFSSLRILPEKYEGKQIGLTKDGFGKVGGIKLKNSNYEQFQKDYDFIEKNYKKLLILD